jgi:hypothetical protein
VLLSALALVPYRIASAPAAGYQEVKEWPWLPSGVQLGEAAGVAVDMNGHVFIFHRPGRGFDTAATAKLEEPPVLELGVLCVGRLREQPRRDVRPER